MGIFSTKNKNNERNVNFLTANKIGAINEGIAVNATLKEDSLFICSRINKSITANLKYEKITNCQCVTDKEIQEKSKSVAGRALIGGLFLGPVGAVVGGLTGVNDKKVTKLRHFIVINYDISEGETGLISLEIVGASLKWDKFFTELKEKANITTELSVEL